MPSVGVGCDDGARELRAEVYRLPRVRCRRRRCRRRCAWRRRRIRRRRCGPVGGWRRHLLVDPRRDVHDVGGVGLSDRPREDAVEFGLGFAGRYGRRSACWSPAVWRRPRGTFPGCIRRRGTPGSSPPSPLSSRPSGPKRWTGAATRRTCSAPPAPSSDRPADQSAFRRRARRGTRTPGHRWRRRRTGWRHRGSRPPRRVGTGPGRCVPQIPAAFGVV